MRRTGSTGLLFESQGQPYRLLRRYLKKRQLKSLLRFEYLASEAVQECYKVLKRELPDEPPCKAKPTPVKRLQVFAKCTHDVDWLVDRWCISELSRLRERLDNEIELLEAKIKKHELE